METNRREIARYNQASIELGFGMMFHPRLYEGPLVLMGHEIKTDPKFMGESDIPEF